MKNIEQYMDYQELIILILKYGTQYPKRHGDWHILNYIDDCYFVMDSWNKRIELIKNYELITNDVYDEIVTVRGERINSLGVDFGRFNLHIDLNLLKFYIENLKYNLNLEYNFNELQNWLNV